MKVLSLAGRLMRQNRWLLLVLVFWPHVMAGLLLLAGGRLGKSDVMALVQQECWYGLAIVGVQAASQLGNEQRSRRIVGVLACAVSRRQYLLALLASAWCPLLMYAPGVVFSGCLLGRHIGITAGQIVPAGATLLVVGLWLGSVAILFSVIVPALIASIAALAAAGLAAWLELLPGALLAPLGLTQGGANASSDFAIGMAIVIAEATLVLWVAAIVFNRRDLNLTAG